MHWRTEPTSVEKDRDDLCLGVKGQSNSEIAGSPRNSFRASLLYIRRGRALNGIRWLMPTDPNQTPNTGE